MTSKLPSASHRWMLLHGPIWVLLSCAALWGAAGELAAAEKVLAVAASLDRPEVHTTGQPEGLTPDRIDALLHVVQTKQKVTATPVVSDERFLRRAMLDLVGRIPTVEEQQAFAAQPDRVGKIRELVRTPEFAQFWSEIWTGVLVGYGDDFQQERTILQDWLQRSLERQTPYDAMVRQMLTTKGPTAVDGAAGFLVRHREEPIIRVSRSFLGVRLDCARCHDHPFDRWTQEDHARMRRFLEPMEVREVSPENFEIVDNYPDMNPEQMPRFLTGANAKTAAWREELALFTVRSKPFARSFANRVWCQLMGRGIVHPPDDLNLENQPVSPELLEALAEYTAASKFNFPSLVELICQTQAYQRESSALPVNAPSNVVFATRSVKPLTGEQIFDSLTVVLGEAPSQGERSEFIQMYAGAGEDQPASQPWVYSESVQALMVRLNISLPAQEGNLETLYQRILCRPPTAEEVTICQNQRMQDIAFALLFGHEFAFNH